MESLVNEVIETLSPILNRHQQQLNQIREQAGEETARLKSEISRLTTDNRKLKNRADLLEQASDDALRNAACAGLAIAASDTTRFNLPLDVVENYLRSRGWKRQPAGFVAPTGGGVIATAVALRCAAGDDLRAVLPSLRQHLNDAAKAKLLEPAGV
jgi:hypothetical protein